MMMRHARDHVAVAVCLAAAFVLAAPRQARAEVILNTTGMFHPGLPFDGTGHAYVDYTMTVTRPGLVTIDLRSSSTSTYDPYLRLFLGSVQVAYDDDGGGSLQSRISQLLQPGVYTVRVSKFGSGPVRVPTPFTLTAVLAGGAPPPPPAYGAPPLTDALARTLASQYYHSYGEWAGQYAMSPLQVRLQPTGPTTVEAHVQYQYSCVRRRCRGAPSGYDQRIFYMQWTGSAWQCVNMGPHMSARF